MTFRSSDARPTAIRLLWALLGAFVLLLSFAGLYTGSLGATEKTGVLAIAIFISWPCFAASRERTYEYHLLEDEFCITSHGSPVVAVGYNEIEYAGYTAENSFFGGVRYIPVSGGILCLLTRPGFALTVDFRRPRRVYANRFFRVVAKRILLTADEPKGLLLQLRLRLPVA